MSAEWPLRSLPHGGEQPIRSASFGGSVYGILLLFLLFLLPVPLCVPVRRRLNDVPIPLIGATIFYFSLYHALSNMAIRKVQLELESILNCA